MVPGSAPSVVLAIETVYASLSVKSAVALSVATVPADRLEIVAVIVSVPSTKASSVVASVITAVLSPSTIEKVVAPVA